ncbi:MAG: zinc ribbon domain-containing protein [Armatimonadota bacterium]|nr:zinc ribbon domain-containing protein [Armatimonadota bacterium]
MITCPHCGAENPEENRFCRECGQAMVVEEMALPPLQEAPPYHPSGRCPGLSLVLGATVLGSLLLGVVYHFITRFIDLIILFPIGAGIAICVVLSAVIHAGKCRNPTLALVCALLAAVLTYGTRQYLDAVRIRSQVLQVFSQASTPQGMPQLREMIEKELTPWVIMTKVRPKEGISLGRRSRSGSGIPIQGMWYWLLVLVEMGLIAGTAAATARASAAAPFCENCTQWKSDTTLFRVHPSQCAALLEKVRAQDWEGAGDLPVGGQIDDNNHCDVIIQRCGQCLDTTLTINSKEGGKTQTLFSAKVAPESVARLVQLGSAAGRTDGGTTEGGTTESGTASDAPTASSAAESSVAPPISSPPAAPTTPDYPDQTGTQGQSQSQEQK